MNLRMQSLFRRLMDNADANGSSGVLDRGDAIPPQDEPKELPKDEPSKDEPPVDESHDEQTRDEDTGKFIPKERHQAVLEKARSRAEAAERRLAEIEQRQQQLNRTADVDKLEQDVADLRKQERAALLDGNEEKAAQLSAQADTLNRRIAIAEAGHMSAQDKDQALEDMRMELTIERMEEKYPVLDSNNEEFDQDIVDDILDKQAGLMQRERLSPSKALAKATESVMKRYTQKETAPEKAGLGAAQAATGRKEAAVAKNLDAAARQPGSMKDSGLDSDRAGQTAPTPDAGNMTVEEFNALPESTRAKMRGDFV